MCKKFLFVLMVLGLFLAPAVHAANIVWVSDAYDERPDSVPDDQAAADFLVSLGHTVDYQIASFGNGYWRTLDDDKIAALNAADLVIVSRNSNSGDYANDATEIARWNGVSAPLIQMTPYITRSNRWVWYGNDSLSEDGGTPTLVAVDPHHPIFGGVELAADFSVDIYDQSVGSGTVSFPGGVDVGNGRLLAKTLTGERTIVAEWDAGEPFYAGGAQTPAGKRMIFCAGTREGEGFGRGEFNLNEQGKILFANAVEYMVGNLVREPWVKAWQPDPADGAKGIALPLFRWTKGETAVFHDIYMGTSPELTAADLAAPKYGMTTYFYGLGLTPGTTYYWRVDEVELDGTTHEGDVWSFSVAPLTAYEPDPKDGAKWIDFEDVTLTWLPGQNAVSHDIYFSTDQTAVAEGSEDAFQVTKVPHMFEAGALEPDTVYYWRVDEHVVTGGLEIGAVWSFRTLGEGGGIRGLYYANADLLGLPVLSRIDPQIDFDWGDATPDATLPNDNFSVRWVGEIDVPFTGTYTFYANTEDGVRLSVNDIQIMDFWTNRRAATEVKASIDLEGGKRYPIVMEFYDSGGVAVAQLSWESPSITKELIPQGAYSAPLRASGPSPVSGAVGVTQAPILLWNAGERAVQHQVYFGQDKDAVAAADTSAVGIYQGQQALDAMSFDPGMLEWNKTYYWRVDEVNNADSESPWIGNVWSFTTADFIVVDDFERYSPDDFETGDAIWEIWIDGLINGTGSIVGYFDPPFQEETIVHSGSQSMPLDYNNIISPYYSEAELPLDGTQDWTINGVTDLTVWFRGSPVSFVEAADGSITMGGAGHDIWDTADDFRFAYKRLNGNGTMTVRVDSIGNTNGWAKGGLMIRESLDPSSKFVYLVVSPANGVSFGWREFAATDCASATQAGLQAPYWVRLTRTGDVFTAEYSADGNAWVDLEQDDGAPVSVSMFGSVLIGLCVTSHNTNAVTTAEFSNVASTGATGQWQVAEIGDDPQPGNSPDQLYVAIQDSSNKTGVVVHPDPAAVNINEWTEWKIPLTDFGVNETRVKTLFIGVGDRDNPTPDGAGVIYIDDIRVTRPEPAE